MWEPLKKHISDRQKSLDEAIAGWIDAYRRKEGRIYCRQGCHRCCSLPVHATLGEALLVAESLSDSQRCSLNEHVTSRLNPLANLPDMRTYLRAHRQQGGFCPFLDGGGGCGIYAMRPFSCRALHSTRPGEWCGVDLSTLHPLEKGAFLDSLDRSVVDFPTHYVSATRQLGQEIEGATCWEMREHFGFSVTGNLALLAWLVAEHDLANHCCRGQEAVFELLGALGLSQTPLLVLTRQERP